MIAARLAAVSLVLGFAQRPQRAAVLLSRPSPSADSAAAAALTLAMVQLRRALLADSTFAPMDERARADSLVRAAQGRGHYPAPAQYWCAARALPDQHGRPRIQLTCYSTATGRPVTSNDRALRQDFAGTAAFLASRAVRDLRADALAAARAAP